MFRTVQLFEICGNMLSIVGPDGLANWKRGGLGRADAPTRLRENIEVRKSRQPSQAGLMSAGQGGCAVCMAADGLTFAYDVMDVINICSMPD